jgi:acyl-coenzyme A synthetase/AMP-(fatty) acid ligase
LIGNVLQPLYAGARCVLMSPMDFLTRPVRWLRAVSKYRATTSGGPLRPVSALPLLTGPEREQALREWNGSAGEDGGEQVR